jgi:hypothetical protein
MQSVPSQADHRGKTKNLNPVFIKLAFTNIENMDMTSLLELQIALQELKAKDLIDFPTLIGVAETWESLTSQKVYKLHGYTYIGKPIARNRNAKRDHGGTGAWIINSMFSQCSVVEAKKQHKDILWIQLIDKTHTTYIAVVYSHPDDPLNHTKIMATLKNNFEELSRTGRVVIMGDFNTRITRTTRKVESRYGDYENKLLAMMHSTGMRPLVANKEALNRNEHWTFVGRNGGRSVNDYILVQPAAMDSSTYRVHQKHNLRSQHRLMTASLPYTHSEATEGWGAQDRLAYEWTDAHVASYKQEIMERYQSS